MVSTPPGSLFTVYMCVSVLRGREYVPDRYDEPKQISQEDDNDFRTWWTLHVSCLKKMN